VAKKSLHPRIKQFLENYLHVPEEQRNDWPNKPNLAEQKNGRRAMRLQAVARELRKIGYVVMVNASKTGLVVIQRADDGD
jgi:hypothetical protein